MKYKDKSPSMNTYKLLLPIIGIITLLSACGDKKQTNPDLQQAFEIHGEALKIYNSARDQIAVLKANTDSIFVATYANDLNAISNSLEEWDEQLVEVPGFDHDHDHAEHDHADHDHSDHDHDHDEHQELTPEQHLAVQQQLLEEIKTIAEKINTIKK